MTKRLTELQIRLITFGVVLSVATLVVMISLLPSFTFRSIAVDSKSGNDLKEPIVVQPSDPVPFSTSYRRS